MRNSKRRLRFAAKKVLAVACAAAMLMSCAVTGTVSVSAATGTNASDSGTTNAATQMKIYDEKGNDISDNPIIYVDNSTASGGIITRKLKAVISNDSGVAVDDSIRLFVPSGTGDHFVVGSRSGTDTMNIRINGYYKYTDDNGNEKEESTKPGTYHLELSTATGEVYRTVTVVVYQPAVNMKVYYKNKSFELIEKDENRGGSIAIANHQYKFYADTFQNGNTDTVEWKVYDGTYVGTGTPKSTSKAEITADGVFTPKSNGTVTVVAKFKATETSDRKYAIDKNKDNEEWVAVPKYAVMTIVKENPAKSLSLQNVPDALEVGETAQLKLDAVPTYSGKGYETGATDEFEWVSSNDKVVKVDSKGLVTAVGKGDAKITVYAENQTVYTECNIRVLAKAQSIRITPSPTSTRVGISTTLTATMSPSDADEEIVWTSSNPKVATVESNASGKFTNSQTATVTGVKAGKVTITATAKNSGVQSKCTVTVNEKIESKNIVLTLGDDPTPLADNSTINVFTMQDITINALLVSDDGKTPDDTITWKVENNDQNLVEVLSQTNKSIKLHGVTEGDPVKVTAISSANKNLKRTFYVQVLRGVNLINILDAKTSKQLSSISLNARDSYALQADLRIQGNQPYAHSDSVKSWKSSNEAVATVDQSGNVTAKKIGTAVITVTAESGMSKSITLTVIEASQIIIKATKIITSDDGSLPFVSLELGKRNNPLTQQPEYYQSTMFTATVYDHYGKLVSNIPVRWSTEDETLATIDETGMLSCWDMGETIVSVSCGSRTDSCRAIITQSMKNASYTPIPDPMYDPNVTEYRPAIVIYVENYETGALEPMELVEGLHYDIVYTNNTKVNSRATFTATGKGYFSGTMTGSFTIKPRVLTDPSVQIQPIEDQECTGKALLPDVTIMHNGYTLQKDVDYTVTGTNNLKPGTATLTIRGKGNYGGNAVSTFDIYCNHTEKTSMGGQKATCQKKGLERLRCNACGETFEEETPIVDHNFVKMNTVAPTYEADGYTVYKCSMCGTTEQRDKVPALGRVPLSKCTITLDKTTFSQINSVQKPTVTVTYGSETLKLNIDYTLSYSDNNSVKAGTYSVTIAGKNGYSGTVTKKYTITAPATPATNIKLDKSAYEVEVGKSITLKTIFSPSNASKEVEWSTSSNAVASVKNGVVTGNRAGAVYITAKIPSGKTATSKVSIRPAPTSLKLDKLSLEMGIGEKYSLMAVATPAKAIRNFTWSTTDASVATVLNGKVTAVGTGTATISVAASNGVTGTCRVTVKDPADMVSLSKSEITIGIGEVYSLTTNIPKSTGAASRIYTTDNTNVLTITKNSGNGMFRGEKEGTANVTVKLYNGLTATCKVTVKKAPTTVKLNKTQLSMKAGGTAELDVTIDNGAGAGNRFFRSSDASVVKVDTSTGKAKLTALKAGTATITVRLYNGLEDTCTVTVK